MPLALCSHQEVSGMFGTRKESLNVNFVFNKDSSYAIVFLSKIFLTARMEK